MAFDLNACGGIPDSTENHIAEASDVINSYGAVTALTSTTVTLDDAANFLVGDHILFHVSAGNSTSYVDDLGHYAFATVTAKSGTTLTINKDLTALADLTAYRCQCVTVPIYNTLTIPEDVTLAPPAFDGSKGGIFILKANTIELNGKIDLADKGIGNANLRGELPSDKNVLDTDNRAGWENSETQYRFVLNVGDGAACLLTNNLKIGSDARIGYTASKGVRFCRGASDSPNKPGDVTNIGGSTILIAAKTITGFKPDFISKYRDSHRDAGKGLARAYIASAYRLANDEGLYSADLISDSTRLASYCKVSDFGNGSSGNLTNQSNVNYNWNVYARITEINKKVVTYADKSKSDLFNRDDLVMIHFNYTGAERTYAGRFCLAHVVSDDGYQIALDVAPPTIDVTKYAAQIIRIPQFNNFTLSSTHDKTPAFQNGKGGICALAVKGTCNLSGGTFNLYEKGGGYPFGAGYGLNANSAMTYGNVQNAFHLPIGAGHGSLFILANNLIMNASTRLGGTHSGASYSGYKGKDGVDFFAATYPTYNLVDSGHGTGGAPYKKGTNANGYVGGYASSSDIVKGTVGKQGAHIFIVANSLTGFNISAISTGGGTTVNSSPGFVGASGGAGYGGSGGYYKNNANKYVSGGRGGYIAGGGGFAVYEEGSDTPNSASRCGGGGAGTAFIYANNVTDQDTSGIVL